MPTLRQELQVNVMKADEPMTYQSVNPYDGKILKTRDGQAHLGAARSQIITSTAGG